ncbi:DUF808 domain-containing protein [Legionella parisiensis]|uniref:Inner membrane protein YedI n=1 Tax=Legionella parisiensis TaxID=45071 RepID=A0A1E5JLV0_9GAMM|nr:DUF808 family protein [Legionella parisiensis]KTD41805.1 Inner membrane protein YedI [Legionella parisiensis]OEH45525.1 Inner membrane protein YedI [Legionella parisiensis]STX75869.1 Inner membrane protein yedI [Legionella parisiensis]
MAGTSLLALIDDIATALDDIAVMTKVATKKTVGVLGDDLALNAQQVLGIHAKRELPVIWEVTKGSILNKCILIPSALLISFFAPPLVRFFLLLGGLYLCFEGFEKIIEKVFHKKNNSAKKIEKLNINMSLLEQDKIRGAIRTDFVLSTEIIVITLGTVLATSLINQVVILIIISLIMTVGVYGLVALIVKLDDLGFILREKKQPIRQIGIFLIGTAPILMKFLGIVGTIAMFLVGGGIITHEVSVIHSYTENVSSILSLGIDFITGIIAGGIAAIVFILFNKLKSKIIIDK